MSVGTSEAGEPIQSDFDDAYPWSDIRRVNLSDEGEVNAYHGEPSFEYDGSNGQVMVEIPKFYYRSENSGNKYRWWISDSPIEGFKIHPAFIRDGVEKDYIYFGAFEGNVGAEDLLRSIVDAKPSTSEDVTGGIAQTLEISPKLVERVGR